jgi:hypothetical protein
VAARVRNPNRPPKPTGGQGAAPGVATPRGRGLRRLCQASIDKGGRLAPGSASRQATGVRPSANAASGRSAVRRGARARSSDQQPHTEQPPAHMQNVSLTRKTRSLIFVHGDDAIEYEQKFKNNILQENPLLHAVSFYRLVSFSVGCCSDPSLCSLEQGTQHKSFSLISRAVLITCCNSVKTRFKIIVQMIVVFFIAGRTLFIYR